jgi:hypothetical protein
MLYVPLGVLAATVTIPLASMLNGPVVNGVTLVVVLRCHLTYHLSMRSMPLPYCLMQRLPMDRSLHLLDCLLQPAVAVSIAGLTFNPVDGFPHNW